MGCSRIEVTVFAIEIYPHPSPNSEGTWLWERGCHARPWQECTRRPFVLSGSEGPGLRGEAQMLVCALSVESQDCGHRSFVEENGS